MLLSGTAAAEDAALWLALRDGGHVSLIRHALTPGIGDLGNFTLNECSRQRNLSSSGRAQARRIGDRFRANGLALANIYTSQWCRYRETAGLFALGPANDLPALNSFFERPGQRAPQTEVLRRWTAEQALAGMPVLLVTHQVNSAALTGTQPTSSELVIFKRIPDGFLSVAGTLLLE